MLTTSSDLAQDDGVMRRFIVQLGSPVHKPRIAVKTCSRSNRTLHHLNLYLLFCYIDIQKREHGELNKPIASLSTALNSALSREAAFFALNSTEWFSFYSIPLKGARCVFLDNARVETFLRVYNQNTCVITA